MPTALEYCDNALGGTWTSNADAWDGDTSTFDYASTLTASAQTYGNIGSTFTNFSAIPSGATIQGILVEVYCYGDGGDYITVEVYKPSASGYVATTKTITPGTGAAWMSAGSSDLWGTTWTLASDIQNALFGVRLTYTNSSKANLLYVGSVRITVTYVSITPVTITRTSAMRWLKATTLTKTSGTRWLKATTLTKTCAVRWSSTLSFTITRTSAVRWLKTQLIDRTSGVRWKATQLIDRSSSVRWLKTQLLSVTSGVRWKATQLIDRTSSIRWRSSTTLSKASRVRWGTDTGGGAQFLRWSKHKLKGAGRHD